MLYVGGGFDGHTCLRSVEMFNPLTAQWTTMTQLLSRRSGVCLVTLHDSVVALGGYDGTTRLRTGEYSISHMLMQNFAKYFKNVCKGTIHFTKKKRRKKKGGGMVFSEFPLRGAAEFFLATLFFHTRQAFRIFSS